MSLLDLRNYVIGKIPILSTYIDPKPATAVKADPVHFYPTPASSEHNEQNEYHKRIVINSRETNPFNNATFFIILQLMILIYVPVSSLLAPYYEDPQSFNQTNSLDEQYHVLRSNIDNYTNLLFPTFAAGL